MSCRHLLLGDDLSLSFNLLKENDRIVFVLLSVEVKIVSNGSVSSYCVKSLVVFSVDKKEKKKSLRLIYLFEEMPHNYYL